MTEGQDWRVQAACRERNPDLWFLDSLEQQAEALLVCGTCPVQRNCLAEALERREPFGTYAGLTAADRSRVLAVPPQEQHAFAADLAEERREQTLAALFEQQRQERRREQKRRWQVGYRARNRQALAEAERQRRAGTVGRTA